uniref:Putative ovule protein n=1 Tax=Solanum chacoense TaxID=4108 RepID=A0A0V0HCU0_SOLCH
MYPKFGLYFRDNFGQNSTLYMHSMVKIIIYSSFILLINVLNLIVKCRNKSKTGFQIFHARSVQQMRHCSNFLLYI